MLGSLILCVSAAWTAVRDECGKAFDNIKCSDMHGPKCVTCIDDYVGFLKSAQCSMDRLKALCAPKNLLITRHASTRPTSHPTARRTFTNPPTMPPTYPTLSPTLAPTKDTPRPTPYPTPAITPEEMNGECTPRFESVVRSILYHRCLVLRGHGHECVATCTKRIMQRGQTDPDNPFSNSLQTCDIIWRRIVQHEWCWPTKCKDTIDYFCDHMKKKHFPGFELQRGRVHRHIFNGCEVCIHHYTQQKPRIPQSQCWKDHLARGYCRESFNSMKTDIRLLNPLHFQVGISRLDREWLESAELKWIATDGTRTDNMLDELTCNADDDLGLRVATGYRFPSCTKLTTRLVVAATAKVNTVLQEIQTGDYTHAKKLPKLRDKKRKIVEASIAAGQMGFDPAHCTNAAYGAAFRRYCCKSCLAAMSVLPTPQPTVSAYCLTHPEKCDGTAAPTTMPSLAPTSLPTAQPTPEIPPSAAPTAEPTNTPTPHTDDDEISRHMNVHVDDDQSEDD